MEIIATGKKRYSYIVGLVSHYINEKTPSMGISSIFLINTTFFLELNENGV